METSLLYEREILFTSGPSPTSTPTGASDASSNKPSSWRVCIHRHEDAPSTKQSKSFIATVHFHEHQSRSTKYASWPQALAFADTQYSRQRSKICNHTTLQLVEERSNIKGEHQSDSALDDQNKEAEEGEEEEEEEGGEGLEFTVLLCYLYVHVPDPEALTKWFTECCMEEMTGRVLVAAEGINANVASQTVSAMEEVIAKINAHPLLGPDKIDFKLDTSTQQPFPDFAVKVVPEIVSTGHEIPVELLTEEALHGNHLSPEEFHEQLDQYLSPESQAETNEKEKESKCKRTDMKPLVLLDVRNRKEIEFGKFESAVSPDTKMFSEWPSYARKNVEKMKQSKVLMYCTGGVRCEKASAYLKKLGVEDVSQLSGGIHRYLESYGADGYFKGANFVFDSRGLQQPEGAETLSRCFNCNQKNDALSSDRVCAVCRDTIVVCDPCCIQRNGVYFCNDHIELDGIYFPFLDCFTNEELVEQRSKLEELCKPGGLYGCPQKRGRRRAIRKQLGRIETALAASSSPTLEASGNIRCRCCGKDVFRLRIRPSSDAYSDDDYCFGSCWGFFQKERAGRGYFDLNDGVTPTATR